MTKEKSPQNGLQWKSWSDSWKWCGKTRLRTLEGKSKPGSMTENTLPHEHNSVPAQSFSLPLSQCHWSTFLRFRAGYPSTRGTSWFPVWIKSWTWRRRPQRQGSPPLLPLCIPRIPTESAARSLRGLMWSPPPLLGRRRPPEGGLSTRNPEESLYTPKSFYLHQYLQLKLDK